MLKKAINALTSNDLKRDTYETYPINDDAFHNTMTTHKCHIIIIAQILQPELRKSHRHPPDKKRIAIPHTLPLLYVFVIRYAVQRRQYAFMIAMILLFGGVTGNSNMVGIWDCLETYVFVGAFELNVSSKMMLSNAILHYLFLIMVGRFLWNVTVK